VEPGPRAGAKRPRGVVFMLLMAIAVGAVAGVGAWGFRMLIGLVHNLGFLGRFAFEYDANVFTPVGPWGVGVVLVPVAGALVVAWLVRNYAPEAKGHGVPEVMDAIYYNEGRIRPRVAVVKSLASAISIGSGGSVGREGPIVQIGSAFGSTLGMLIAMRASERVTLIAAGAGAGIAATFNAPLGGVLFAIELLLVSVTAGNLLLVTAAVVVATRISHLLLGTYPSFYVPALETPDLVLACLLTLVVFMILGVAIGIFSVAFIRGLYWMEDVFEALPGNYYTRHALGMFCVGVMMLLLFRHAGHYYVEGVGYATIMEILRGGLTSVWFLLLLAALKLLATCLSLGSGASGGVFSPGLFMGAAAGAAFGHLCESLAPGLGVTIPTFAIAGMAAMISGSTGAVLTAIVMLTEMTRDHSVILPVLVTSALAYAVRKGIMEDSIYTMKLRARRHVVPQGLHAGTLTTERLADLMAKDFAVVSRSKAAPEGAAIVVRSDDGIIAGVDQRSGAASAAAGGRALRYEVLPEQATPLSAVRAVCEEGVEIILVSRRPDSRRAEDVVGVVPAAVLARAVATTDEIS
jgi:chloride channel protein, CIC family